VGYRAAEAWAGCGAISTSGSEGGARQRCRGAYPTCDL